MAKQATCESCDLYVDRRTLNNRYKRFEIICRLTGKHMHPIKCACVYHQARRKDREIKQLIKGGFING